MISDEQRTRLQDVINHRPTNPPSPSLSPSELDEIRALVAAGREADANAALIHKANAACAASFEAMKKKSAEMGREMERKRMEQKEHAARMSLIQAQKNEITATTKVPHGEVDEKSSTTRMEPEQQKYGPDRDARIANRVKQLKNNGTRGFMKKVVAEEGVTMTAIKEAVSRHAKRQKNETQTASLFGQLKAANK